MRRSTFQEKEEILQVFTAIERSDSLIKKKKRRMKSLKRKTKGRIQKRTRLDIVTTRGNLIEFRENLNPIMISNPQLLPIDHLARAIEKIQRLWCLSELRQAARIRRIERMRKIVKFLNEKVRLFRRTPTGNHWHQKVSERSLQRDEPITKRYH